LPDSETRGVPRSRNRKALQRRITSRHPHRGRSCESFNCPRPNRQDVSSSSTRRREAAADQPDAPRCGGVPDPRFTSRESRRRPDCCRSGGENIIEPGQRLWIPILPRATAHHSALWAHADRSSGNEKTIPAQDAAILALEDFSEQAIALNFGGAQRTPPAVNCRLQTMRSKKAGAIFSRFSRRRASIGISDR